MDCLRPDWGSIVDAELQETKVKIGQGEDYRPVLEPEMLQPAWTGWISWKRSRRRRSGRDPGREDERREMHAAALRAQEEREYWNELAKADAEAAKQERERVMAIEKRVEAEAAAAAQRRVREEALLDAVLGWTDAAGEREARLLARSAERAAEEAAKVIDGMDDVVEATQAKNSHRARREHRRSLDELVAPSVDAVDDAMAAFERPPRGRHRRAAGPHAAYADDRHDDETRTYRTSATGRRRTPSTGSRRPRSLGRRRLHGKGRAEAAARAGGATTLRFASSRNVGKPRHRGGSTGRRRRTPRTRTPRTRCWRRSSPGSSTRCGRSTPVCRSWRTSRSCTSCWRRPVVDYFALDWPSLFIRPPSWALVFPFFQLFCRRFHLSGGVLLFVKN